jgi:hypothetical protein
LVAEAARRGFAIPARTAVVAADHDQGYLKIMRG